MVVIGEDEFNDLQAEVIELDARGKPIKHKFAKDKFYMKDMELATVPYTEEDMNQWFDWFEAAFPGRFKRNDTTGVSIEAFPYIGQRPPFFSDQQAMQKTLEFATEAEAKMLDAEVFTKKRRKDRRRLFDNTLKEFLNTECGTNYKIKYDK